jgi:CBS domain containing-hemolysin-like protein
MNLLIDFGAAIDGFAPVAPTDTVATGSIGGLLFYISFALVMSFTCSLLEAVLLTSSNSTIEVLSKTGSQAGVLMRKHKQRLELTLSAILTLNTFAHTIGAAGAGAEAVGVFGNELFGLISFVLTVMILLFSEILPKTIGATYWRGLLPFAAYTLQAMVIVMYPALVAINWFARLFGRDGAEPTVTRAELEVLADASETGGGLAQSENRVLKNLLRLGEKQVYDIMTPRSVMLALPGDMTVAEASRRNKIIPYSRIPIYLGGYDDIYGYVLRSEILAHVAVDADHITLDSIKRPIHSVPETLRVDRVLDQFVAQGQHIFLVMDEYGGTSGIITLEDALESLLGAEIMDETDTSRDMRELALQRSREKLAAMGIEPPAKTTPTEDQNEPNPPAT